MIEPTNGRIVWYTPYDNEIIGSFGMCVQRDSDGKIIPLAADVVAVWGPRCINLLVKDANGKTFVCTSRPLLQDDDARPEHGGFAEWMPYQMGQAAKTEKLEAILADSRPSSTSEPNDQG